MSALARLRNLFLPVSIGLLVLLVAGLYNLVWLPSQHKYLDNRNFRLLSTLNEQISISINTFDMMLDNAADSGVPGNDTDNDDDTDTNLSFYLKQVAPRLKSVDKEEQKVLGNDFGDPPYIAVKADEGTHFLYLAFKRTQDTTSRKYAVRTDLDKLIRDLLPPANRNPFDVLLVAQKDGAVIFQSSAPGLAVTNIDAFEDRTFAAKTDKPVSAAAKPEKSDSTDGKAQLQSTRYSSNQFSEINLAGTPYRLYSQPIQLSFSLNHPERKDADRDVAPRPTEQWVVCALVRAEAFRSESESISYTFFLWVSAAVFLALLAPPFLKLFVSAPAERLRASELGITAIFACAVAATLTFILLDLFHWRKDFDEQAKEQMESIARAIDGNFTHEQEAAFDQLNKFSEDEKIQHLMQESHPKHRPTFAGKDGICDPPSACQTQILADDSAENLFYPYLQFAAWSDAKGDQQVKWTIRGHATPFINLDDGTIPYYPAIKRALEDRGVGAPVPTQGIGTQYSPNTGYNITAFWQVFTMPAKSVPGRPDRANEKNVFCASLVTRPISVSGPVLPADFQFAIVNKDGLVIFHSDFTRNLRENFFAETDQDVKIRSLVLMRGEDALTANYMGRSHRMYVLPMKANAEELWSVIVFRDLRLEQTMNLEVLSLATMLFSVYALIAALAMGATLLLKKGHGARHWLWPDSRKSATYGRLAIINIFAIVLLLFVSRIPLKLPLLFCAASVPVGILIFNLLALKREAEPVDEAKDKMPARWVAGYAGTSATLLAVVAVLPCLSFFRVAWDFEQKLFLERSQIRLIDDVKARRQSLQAYYQDVRMGEKNAQKLLAEPGDQEQLKFSYEDSFQNTRMRPVKGVEPSAECSLGTARGTERCMEIFLGMISPPYNQLAADGRSLAKASPDIWKWSSGLSNGDNSDLSIGKEHLQLEKQAGKNETKIIVESLLPRLQAPWGHWQWWLGSIAFLVGLLLMVYYGLKRVFMLDIDHSDDPAAPNYPGIPRDPTGGNPPSGPFDAASLIAKLAKNLVIVSRSSSSTVAHLLERQDVQAYDLSQPLVVPLRRAASQGGGSSDVNVSANPVEEIVRDGRPVVFYNFESGLEVREQSQRKLAILDNLLSKPPQSVVVISMVDPVVNSPQPEQEQWETVFRSFVRIDLNASPSRRADETVDQCESRISADAYYHWLLAGRSKAQKLALVQLAQEGVVNAKSRGVVRELMNEGLVVRRWGLITIIDHRFAHFLNRAIPRESIKHWESQGAGIHASMLRTSLVVAGIGIGAFLLYTQAAIFNNWITYMTGLAAAVPAVMKLLDVLPGSGNAPVH